MNTIRSIARITAEEAAVRECAVILPHQLPCLARRIAITMAADLSDEPVADVATFFAVPPKTLSNYCVEVSAATLNHSNIASLIAAIQARIPRHWPERLRSDSNSITPVKIAAALHFDIAMARLEGPERMQRYAVPRMIAMCVARETTNKSTPEIGRRFGGRDHTTVLSAQRRIAALCRKDAKVAAALEAVRTIAKALVQQAVPAISILNPSAAIPPLPRGAACPGSASPLPGHLL